MTWPFAKSGDKTALNEKSCLITVMIVTLEKLNEGKPKENKQHPKRRDEKTGVENLAAFLPSSKLQSLFIREIVQAYPLHNSLIIPEMEELAGKNHCLVLPRMCTDGRVPGRMWWKI